MGSKGQSLGRAMRRGKVDQYGRPLRKRPFSNKKNTKGRKANTTVKYHYHEMMRRLRYIKKLSRILKNEGVILTEENWKQEVRKHDKHELFLDDYEKGILFMHVNS